jgi:hypothetical protein
MIREKNPGKNPGVKKVWDTWYVIALVSGVKIKGRGGEARDRRFAIVDLNEYFRTKKEHLKDLNL